MIASKKEVKAEPKQETVSRARYLIGTLYTPPVGEFFPTACGERANAVAPRER